MYASKQVAKVGKVKTNYVIIMKCYLRNLEHKMGQCKIQQGYIKHDKGKFNKCKLCSMNSGIKH